MNEYKEALALAKKIEGRSMLDVLQDLAWALDAAYMMGKRDASRDYEDEVSDLQAKLEELTIFANGETANDQD